MRKDQIFVLLLVIFLPMTGCFGDAIGEVEAEDGVANLHEHTETVLTVHIGEGESHNITLNGTTLKLVEVWYQDVNDYWRMGGGVPFEMRCVDGFSMTSSAYINHESSDAYLPILPNQECTIEMNWQSENAHSSVGPEEETILIFKEVELSAI